LLEGLLSNFIIWQFPNPRTIILIAMPVPIFENDINLAMIDFTNTLAFFYGRHKTFFTKFFAVMGKNT
jgi:hypothetical protein